MALQVVPHSLFTDFDIGLFQAGKHYRLYEKMGSHLLSINGQSGVYFAVWAPNARQVSVVGNFNAWHHQRHPLHVRWDGSGIWEGFIPGLEQGEVYKFWIDSHNRGPLEKADPYAFYYEKPPRTASIVWPLPEPAQPRRGRRNHLEQAQSVYEMHLGSWRRPSDSSEPYLNYRKLADELIPYLQKLHYTHVEFMPVMEHPFYGSWGYQIHGYYAPTSRYGPPEDFAALVQALQEAGIGVYLDWVPSHFPGDAHGLFQFDGTSLYEHADPRKGFHPDWKSYIFNYGRHEVKSFLISNAVFWLDRYGVDGLRVDAVASMLYLDYSREGDAWVPNEYGGRENLEAIAFMKELNEELYRSFPDCQSIAEESTSWPGVSQPTFNGGLGFGMKWMMGWMNDTLEYFKKDPLYRRHHHNMLSFGLTYAFNENFMLPLSHDEVVHGKGALIERMPGDEWQRFANLRLLYAFQYSHPGQKLLFMGCEWGATREWKHEEELPWQLLEYAPHQGVQRLVGDLNALFTSEPALYARNFSADGFEWIDYGDAQNSVLSLIRHGAGEQIAVVLNFTPNPHQSYRIGVPAAGRWEELLNTDSDHYWGSGFPTLKEMRTRPESWHGKAQHLDLKVPPLGAVFLKYRGD